MTLWALAVIGAGLSAASAHAQDAPRIGFSALTGVVTDSLRNPLKDAIVIAEEAGQAAVTDSAGRFHLAVVRAASGTFTVKRIGYQPVTFEVDLLPDSTVMIAIRLRRLQILEALEVTAEPYARRFIATGFEDRQKLGLGTFISPARIDSLRPYLQRTSDLLRNVRGIEIRCGPLECQVRPRHEPRCLSLFVDGVFIDDQLDKFVPPGLIYAIEVYERPMMVPTQFQGRLPRKSSPLTVAAGCGALVIWTQSRR